MPDYFCADFWQKLRDLFWYYAACKKLTCLIMILCNMYEKNACMFPFIRTARKSCMVGFEITQHVEESIVTDYEITQYFNKSLASALFYAYFWKIYMLAFNITQSASKSIVPDSDITHHVNRSCVTDSICAMCQPRLGYIHSILTDHSILKLSL